MNRRAERGALDVVVSFNEVDPAVNPAYMPKTIAGRAFGFVEQVTSLGRSLRRHLPEATLWAVHTEPLRAESAEKLSVTGWNVVSGTRAVGPRVAERLNDRLCAYQVGEGAQLLVLDADSIVVAPVTFDQSRPVRVGFAGDPTFSRHVWKELYGIVGLRRGPLPLPRAFDAYFYAGLRLPTPFFNNGAVLVQRSALPAFVGRIRDAGVAIVDSGIIDREPRVGHFLDQVCLSLAVLQTANWGLLPRGFNSLASRVNIERASSRRRVSHYHYLGSGFDSGPMERYYGEYFAGV